jgi:hypothetical protein
VPLPFVIDKDVTVDEVGVKSVQIKGPGEAYEKRQATLQICFRGIGEQPRLAIIFRGMDKHSGTVISGKKGNISDNERRELDLLEIDWYFQPKVSALQALHPSSDSDRLILQQCNGCRHGRTRLSREVGWSTRWVRS